MTASILICLGIILGQLVQGISNDRQKQLEKEKQKTEQAQTTENKQ